MSRNIFENKEYYLAYGIDDYLGKFVQIYSKEKGGLTEDGCLVFLSEKENGMTMNDLILTAQVFDFDLSDQGKLVETIRQ